VNDGDIVDDFELLDQHGASVSLTSLVAEGPIVLFFYPKAMTPG
jgi:thioredoxin-dependent peroxiredoxin